ncbi:protein KASH5 isoform X4 [Ictidomys tridecemlineatus]
MDLPEGRAGGPAAEMYLWEQPEEVSPGPLLSLEEQILNSTFEACDPQRTGTVAVTHVLAYLEAVTGQGPQDSRLQTLARSLDPKGEGPGATVDLDTFLVVMRNWIAACQLRGGLELGEETALEGALTSQQLPSGFPEAEEPANLESFGGEDTRPEMPATADLLSSLEDLELSNRRLAGENAKLQRSVETAEEGSARLTEEILALRRQLRSTQQALQFAKAVDEELEDLKSLAKSLEEKNRGLLAQARQTEKEQQYLVAEVETLQEEELRLEISHLEEQLNQTSEEPEELLEEAQARRAGWTTLVPTSLGLEIEAICQGMAGSDLSSPLCGVWQWEEVINEPQEETEFSSEILAGAQSNPEGETAHLKEGTKAPLQRLSRREEEEEVESLVTTDTPILLGDPHSENIPGSPPESSSVESEFQQALVPVVKELVPVRRPWGQCCLHPQRLRVTQHLLVPAPILGLLLLLLLLSVLLLGQSQPPTWPHLQLCYLQPPPV